MELKELTSRICDLFGCVSVDTLPDKIMFALFSQNSTLYFEKYKELCPDLTVDWLQRVYQFYHADRKEKKQDYTPVSLAKLVSFLSYMPSEKLVYDCCCGSGALTIQKWCTNPDLKFVCEELDERVIPILLFNLCIRNIEATVINKDILSGNIIHSYNTIKGTVYASVQRPMFPETELMKADVGVSNPPFNLRVSVSETILKDLPQNYTCNFAFVAHCLQRSDRCALILPRGVLTSEEEKECRKFLIEKGWLQAAISLPEKMFESTSVATCILVLDKREKSKDVMLINAEEMKSVEVREQRGEGDASHYNRIYKKEFNTFSDEQIAAICELTIKEQDSFSKRISQEELEQHGYNLIIGPYLPIEFEGTVHRDFNAIISDINRIIRERNVIKVTVNKVWAEKLGLTEVIRDCEASNEIVKAMNESLASFKNYEVKEKIIENKYIQSSNSKVFVIENTDKEILSSIMPFFMNMYKQHLYYLNNEENRLLAELRDSMLPLLMNEDLMLKDSDE
ncbi:HsdM family class I SAM-dependent methyltransferase [Bacteroides finegoldii]|uniref:HsdM family class I SAM-dependent methyltransferase n=1 Tax=Bacteroides finegoldii TaxID=338188 RepID=UPI0022DFD3B1|nr:N-6 DNA methylase [Bacteroides finegoldii]